MAGFDIPQLLSGVVTTELSQECMVVLPNGKEIDAILTLKDEGCRWYGLITLPDDLPNKI